MSGVVVGGERVHDILVDGDRRARDSQHGIAVAVPESAYLEWLRQQQVPWRFGTDEPEAFLASFGWNATARRPGDEGAAYGRWPYLGLPRGTPGYPSIYYVTAARD